MPGDGTKQATTPSKAPPARVLDLTRTVSRAGRRPTGIDRAELAYLDHVLAHSVPAYGLVRTGAGYLLLDQSGLEQVQDRLHGRAPWGRADHLSGLFRKRPAETRRAESDLRRVAVGRCRAGRAAAMLARNVPGGSVYLNVGHTQLDNAHLSRIRDGLSGQVAVLIHDTIPLDFPEFQRPVIPGVFAARLRAVQAGADLIICNSRHTEARVKAHMSNWGPVPRRIVAPLGLDTVMPDSSGLPSDLDLSRPYFVALGTIEPRKRHDVLLDVWDELNRDLPPEKIPGLMICGARGWNNDAVFHRLDALPAGSPVREMSGLSDAAIAALLQGARALLSPSEAEGYGLPPLEAAALGTLPVVLELPVYRETLGNIAVYLNETEGYLWRNIVERLTVETGRKPEAGATRGFVPPAWADHFDIVFDSA